MLSADFSQTDFLSAGVGVGWGGGKLHPLTGRLCLPRGEEGANLEMRVPLQFSGACPWGSHLALPASYGDWETPRWSPARDSPGDPVLGLHTPSAAGLGSRLGQGTDPTVRS